MDRMNFIKTSDKETADKLLSLGFILLDQSNRVYTFANCQAQIFSKDINIDKITYSNIMCI